MIGGRTVTKSEKELHNRIASNGCIACRKDGNWNPVVSIHHIRGRTRKDAHKLVLPLCAQHHQQDDTDPLKRIGVHPFTARFENKYGKQMDLLAEVMETIGEVDA